MNIFCELKITCVTASLNRVSFLLDREPFLTGMQEQGQRGNPERIKKILGWMMRSICL
jgi:hypothetical protein